MPWYTMTSQTPSPTITKLARDLVRRLRPDGPVEIRVAQGARGACQQILSSMRPKVEIHSGVDFSRPCYVFVLNGTFPSHVPTDDPRRAAAVIVDAHTQRTVSSCVSIDLPGTSSLDFVPIGVL
jgi:hypothetical protein